MRFLLRHRDDTVHFAAVLAQYLRPGDFVLLSGELGAGKTTLTQALGTALGVTSRIVSPTFVLARHHKNAGEGPDLVHVDAYRLSSLQEVEDLGLTETASSAITVVEWGEGLVEALSDARLVLRLRFAQTCAEVTKRHLDESSQGQGHNLEDEAREVELIAGGERWHMVDFSALDRFAPPTSE